MLALALAEDAELLPEDAELLPEDAELLPRAAGAFRGGAAPASRERANNQGGSERKRPRHDRVGGRRSSFP